MINIEIFQRFFLTFLIKVSTELPLPDKVCYCGVIHRNCNNNIVEDLQMLVPGY